MLVYQDQSDDDAQLDAAMEGDEGSESDSADEEILEMDIANKRQRHSEEDYGSEGGFDGLDDSVDDEEMEEKANKKKKRGAKK